MTIAYTRVKDAGIVPYSARVGVASGTVTFTDQTTKTTQQVPVARNKTISTRLIKTHAYTLSGSGITATLTPGGKDGYVVKAATGTVENGEAVTDTAGQAVFTSGSQILGENGERYKLEPAKAQVILSSTKADYRVGDRLYVPPFGFNFGGEAVKVTDVSLKNGTTVLTLADLPAQELLHTLTADNGKAELDKAVFVPADDVAVSGTPAKGLSLTQTSWYDGKLEASANAYMGESFTYSYPKNDPKKAKFTASNELSIKGSLDFDANINLFSEQYKVTAEEALTYGNHTKISLTATPDNNKFLKKLKDGKPIGEIHIPTAVPLVSITIPIKLVLDANGELGVELNFDAIQKATLSINNKGIKFKPTVSSETSGKVGAKGEVKVGLDAAPGITILAGIDCADLSAFAGLDFNANADFSFENKSVSPVKTSTDSSLSGDFIASAKAESKLPELIGKETVESKSIEFRIPLFKWPEEKKTTAKVKEKKPAEKTDSVDGATAKIPDLTGKVLTIIPLLYDGEDSSKAMDDQTAPTNLVHDYSGYGYFKSNSEFRLTGNGNYIPVWSDTVTFSDGVMTLKPGKDGTDGMLLSSGYTFKYAVKNGQLVFPNWTTTEERDGKTHTITWSATITDDSAQREMIENKPMQQ
ncbi:hypothetical protein [Lacticaseibacillus mingshuiensis]|uniref:Uncharacterized protein n=1 Tax=Lacticaseibacillus mingshuiensis TaxID=2799574 RepID=A0ABW4CFR0_9LACO|nr:hypothetical protein [Lacticaseibacillus mingshuiensis]